jgi:hypothetical protein
MKKRDPWTELVAHARRAPAEPAEPPPFGFVERVAARGLAVRPEPRDWLGLFAWRALGLAVVVLLASVAASYPHVTGTNSLADDEDDPVSELMASL